MFMYWIPRLLIAAIILTILLRIWSSKRMSNRSSIIWDGMNPGMFLFLISVNLPAALAAPLGVGGLALALYWLWRKGSSPK